MPKRDVTALKSREYDLVIIGGGIFGACAAWDAVLRGLSIALIEAADFGGGVSANSFKMVHGGIRYLQHGDLVRLRASCRERSALLRIAPHLVQPLPILIPTYGYGRLGKLFLGSGARLYDLLTLDRNRGIHDHNRQVPASKFLDRTTVIGQFPDLDKRGLTGGVLIHDGQMYNPTRLVLAFIHSAAEAGACIANYVAAESLLREGNRVVGVQARDQLSGSVLHIRGRMMLNAAGPWAERLLQGAGLQAEPTVTYSRDACFVIRRRPGSPHALAVQGQSHDPDAILARPARHLFLVPWRDYTLVGVWHGVTDVDPGKVTVGEEELAAFIDEINEAYPQFQLTRDEVCMWNAGLVPFGDNEPDAKHLSYGKRSHIIDHARKEGVQGLVTLIGVRYTMGRGDAARAIDLVCRQLGHAARRSATHRIPIHGGDMISFESCVREVAMACQCWRLTTPVIRALAHNHGTAYDEILQQIERDPPLAGTLGGSTVLAAEIRHAITQEMAQTLSDLVFRRTDLATAGNPGDAILRSCADLAAAELGWDDQEIERQLQAVKDRFPAESSGVGRIMTKPAWSKTSTEPVTSEGR